MNTDIERLLDEADLLVGSYMLEPAIARYSEVLEQDSDNYEARLMRGTLFGKIGQIEKAVTDIETAIRLDDTDATAFITLAALYEKKNMGDRALALYKSAISLKNHDDTINQFVRLSVKLGNEKLAMSFFDEAEGYYTAALRYQEDNTALLYRIVLTLRSSGKIEASMRLAEKIIEIEPGHIRAQAHIASSYEMIGDINKGRQLIEELLSAYPDHPMVAMVYAQFSIRSNEPEKGISALDQVLSNQDVQEEDVIGAHMLLGKLYDSSEQYEPAFSHYKRANEISEYSNRYDPASYTNYISSLIDYFSDEKYASIAESKNQSDELIFIVGMPRSGTSLVEQIISSHSAVFGAGELPYVNNAVNAMQADETFQNSYPHCMDEISKVFLDQLASKLVAEIRGNNTNSIKIIDKLPHNFHHIGLIHKLFPKAKIINCVRDARDTCISCYFQFFGGYHLYANNLRSLGVHYLEYERLMEHWMDVLNIPVHTITYENIVYDTRGEIERALEFLRLPWEDNCMEFYKQKRVVATASYDQVNKKIYTKSLERWKNYEKNIFELLDVLGDR